MSKKIIFYTDGSYNEANDKIGSSFVALDSNGKIIKEQKYNIPPEGLSQYRNVAGEIYAVAFAIEYAIKNGYEEIVINCDYIGCKKWADGEWKAKNKLTRNYQRYVKSRRLNRSIEFKIVKGHSGNKLNNRADLLAKSVVGL